MSNYQTFKTTSTGKAKTLATKQIRKTRQLEAKLSDRSLSRLIEMGR